MIWLFWRKGWYQIWLSVNTFPSRWSWSRDSPRHACCSPFSVCSQLHRFLPFWKKSVIGENCLNGRNLGEITGLCWEYSTYEKDNVGFEKVLVSNLWHLGFVSRKTACTLHVETVQLDAAAEVDWHGTFTGGKTQSCENYFHVSEIKRQRWPEYFSLLKSEAFFIFNSALLKCTYMDWIVISCHFTFLLALCAIMGSQLSLSNDIIVIPCRFLPYSSASLLCSNSFHCACLDLLTLDLFLLFLILSHTNPFSGVRPFPSPCVIFGRAMSQIYPELPSCLVEVHTVNGSWAISAYPGKAPRFRLLCVLGKRAGLIVM